MNSGSEACEGANDDSDEQDEYEFEEHSLYLYILIY